MLRSLLPRLALLVLLPAASALAVDTDLDGVEDPDDNCVQVPNADQADANAPADDDTSLPGIQRYGDACDVDLDDDGVVGPSDFFAGLRPCIGQAATGACAIADLDGDGVVGPSDFFARLRPALGSTPGPGRTLPSVVPLMLPDRPSGFFTFPWPNDIRVDAAGSPDLIGLPAPGQTGVFLNFILGTSAAETTGFGLNSAAFLRTSGGVDPASLPTPTESQADGAEVMLVDLDAPTSPRTPILVDFKDASAATGFRPENLLAALPYPGNPLEEETRYALLVFDGVLDTTGSPIGPAPLLSDLEDPFGPGTPVSEPDWTALQQQRSDVLAYVAAHTTHDASDLVAFSVFTTQDATSELAALTAAVEAAAVPTLQNRTQLVACGSGQGRIRADIDLPKYQVGVLPYALSGGAIVVGGDGLAVQQSTETVRLDIAFPCGPAPAEGWPILLFMDGTGGSANAFTISELGHGPLDPLPFVIGSIAPLYSGDRSFAGQEPASLFFNLGNPLAARTNQIQQAVEMIVLRRLMQELVLTPAEIDDTAPALTDDTRVAAAGHSQGALTLPQTLSADPAIGAAFLSMGGGGLYHTILNRGDTRPFVEDLLGFLPGELDLFHPTIHALQSVIEVGDATNYARKPQTAHVLSLGGLLDGCSPWEVVFQIGNAFGLDLANASFAPTFGDPAQEPTELALPVTANLPDGRTGLTVQLATGHFGAGVNTGLGRSFVESFGATGLPTVDSVPLSSDTGGGACPRFAPIQ